MSYAPIIGLLCALTEGEAAQRGSLGLHRACFVVAGSNVTNMNSSENVPNELKIAKFLTVQLQ